MAPIPGSVRVTGFIAPSDSTDTYAAQDEFYNRGGWRTVANLVDRNAITADRRKVGMIVRVLDAGGGIEKFYTLVGGIADINWVEQVFSGGSGYYPKYLVGVGTTYPFNTIQAAINQAITDGKGTAAAPALVLVDAGVYTENLTLHEHIHVVGLAGGGPEWPVEVRGSATYSPTALAALDNQLNIRGIKLSQPTADTPVLTVTGAAASALVNLRGCGVYKTFGGVAPNILVNATSATQVSVAMADCAVHRLWALAGKIIEFTGAVVATTTALAVAETNIGDLNVGGFVATAIDLPRGVIAVADGSAVQGRVLLGAAVTAGVLHGSSFKTAGFSVLNVAAGAVNVEMVECTVDTDTAPTVTGAGIFKYALIRFKNLQGFAATLNAGAGALPIVLDDASNIRYDNTISGLLSTNVKAAIDELAAKASGIYRANRLPVETPNGVLTTFTLPGGDQYVPGTLLVALNGAIYQPSSINEIGPGYTTFQIVGGDTIPSAVDSFTVSYNKV